VTCSRMRRAASRPRRRRSPRRPAVGSLDGQLFHQHRPATSPVGAGALDAATRTYEVLRCSECKREPREDENPDDEWRSPYRDGGFSSSSSTFTRPAGSPRGRLAARQLRARGRRRTRSSRAMGSLLPAGRNDGHLGTQYRDAGGRAGANGAGFHGPPHRRMWKNGDLQPSPQEVEPKLLQASRTDNPVKPQSAAKFSNEPGAVLPT
jgi:hypothetical protein